MLKELLQGRFINHPLHPIFVHLPVGLWVTSLILDIVYMANHQSIFAQTSFYCILIGLIGASLAIPTGFADYLSIRSKTVAKRLATAHMLLNIAVFGLFFYNIISRYALSDQVPMQVTGMQLGLSILCVLLLGVSGYLGGLLVFEYAIGYRPEERDEERDEERNEEDHLKHAHTRKRAA
jgi:uncharacterized membrane protein